jgi:hypothetical protein
MEEIKKAKIIIRSYLIIQNLFVIVSVIGIFGFFIIIPIFRLPLHYHPVLIASALGAISGVAIGLSAYYKDIKKMEQKLEALSRENFSP